MSARFAFGIVLPRLLLFALTFMIDVRVRAESLRLPLAREIYEQPEHCWTKADVFPCAVRTQAGERGVLKAEGIELHLDQSTTIVRTALKEIRLLSGGVWLQGDAAFVVSSEFGSVRSEHGEFWVSRTQGRMLATAILSPLRLQPRGSSEAYELPAGMENWLGRVGPEGRARMGLPMAIAFGPHLTRWARLYPGTRAEFEKAAEDFYERWQTAARESAEIHKAVFERKIASLEEEKARKLEARRKVQSRDRELLDLFRRKLSE